MAFIDYFRKKQKAKKDNVIDIDIIESLPTFSDEDLGLYWNRITSDNIKENEQYFEQMSSWSGDAGIQRYIASRTPINKLFRDCISSGEHSSIKGKSNLYFCFNDNADFVGLAYISAPIGQNKHSTLEYIIVNPEFQRAGIGTKMVKSISTYINYFNNGNECDGIVSSVEQDNIASSRAFLKNNFRVVSANTSDTGRIYNVFYLSARNKTSDIDSMVG